MSPLVIPNEMSAEARESPARDAADRRAEDGQRCRLTPSARTEGRGCYGCREK